MAGVGRAGEVTDKVGEGLAGQLAAQARGQGAPLVLVERGPSYGPVEVLQCSAPRLGSHELDAVVVTQHPHVVADDPERSPELHREIAGLATRSPRR